MASSPAEPTGISRRSHPKSRKGCQLCKTRKIKCDESRPQCQNCVKHGVPCPYTSSAAGAPPTPLSICSPTADAPSAIPPGLDESSRASVGTTGPFVFDMLDLELLHNFTTATYATLTNDAVVRDAWRLSGVRMALGCEFVMKALLAVSGLHISHFRPPARRDVYVERALQHHREAARAAMPLMANGAKQHGEQLYLFSALTVYFALASPKSDNYPVVGDSFPDWLFLLRGSRHIIEMTKVHLDEYQGLLVPFLKHGRRRWSMQHDPRKTRRDLLTDLEMRVQGTVEETKTPEDAARLLPIYDRAIKELRQALSVCLSADEGGGALDIYDAFIWHFVVADDFMPLLKEPPEQEAVVIFAHFCILLKKLESHWWLQGWGTHLVGKAWELLDQEHRLWIQWPIQEIGFLPPE